MKTLFFTRSATCTTRGGPGGCGLLSAAGLWRRGGWQVPPRRWTRPLTHRRQRGASSAIQWKTARRSSAFNTQSKLYVTAESGGARLLMPPGSASIGSLSAGTASHTHTHKYTLTHTHTVSICSSIAPHGRARPRAVTQMALGDFQMTHLQHIWPGWTRVPRKKNVRVMEGDGE